MSTTQVDPLRHYSTTDGIADFHANRVLYRCKELANLTPESFDLDGQTPIVNLGATSTKNKKTVVQPIPPQVADLMRGFIQGIEAGQAVFPLKRSGGGIRRTSKMMQVDLDLARAEWIEEAKDYPEE